jgi:hypothetical protein
MYTFKHRKDITTEKEMMAFLKGLRPINPQGSIAIVGGHFMLFYDKDEDCLKPLIHQDLTKDKQIAFAKLMTGDFPVRTFNYSMELIKHFHNNGNTAGNVFIINDHKFQSADFQPSILDLVKNRGGELRTQFYRGKHVFPKIFQNLIEKHGYDDARDVVFDNDDSKRQGQDILPRKTIFYSEQALRNRFDKKTKTKILQTTNFYEQDLGYTKEIFYNDGKKQFCLTEQGKCGCSSEIMEFLWNILERGFNKIIMFIPQECESHVNNGVEMALTVDAFKSKLSCEIFVITGLGGLGEDKMIIKPNVFYHEIKAI